MPNAHGAAVTAALILLPAAAPAAAPSLTGAATGLGLWWVEAVATCSGETGVTAGKGVTGREAGAESPRL